MYTHIYIYIYVRVCVCRVHRISLGVCFFSQTKANREKQREAEKRKQQKALAKVGGRDPMAPGVSGFGGPTGYPQIIQVMDNHDFVLKKPTWGFRHFEKLLV